MTQERYTIEPPPERQREMSRDRKIDRIYDILTHRDDTPSDNAPEVTFEADPEHLPTTDNNEPTEDETGQGEGTANVERPTAEQQYRFPGARRHALTERSSDDG